MPDRDLSYEMESEIAYPGDFRTLVDGRPVRMSVERKAMVGGVDRTAELVRLRIPITPPEGERAGVLADAIGRLPRAAQQRLARLGLIDAASLADSSHADHPDVDGQGDLALGPGLSRRPRASRRASLPARRRRHRRRAARPRSTIATARTAAAPRPNIAPTALSSPRSTG